MQLHGSRAQIYSKFIKFIILRDTMVKSGFLNENYFFRDHLIVRFKTNSITSNVYTLFQLVLQIY